MSAKVLFTEDFKVGDWVMLQQHYPAQAVMGEIIEIRAGLYHIRYANGGTWWFGSTWIDGLAFQTVFDL